MKLYNDLPTEEIRKFGCLRENCEQINWERVWVHHDKARPDLQNLTVVNMNIQRNIPTKIIKHTLAYDYTNFIADFGGYLGLLLGASILSIYDFWIGLVDKGINWNKNKP